MNVESVWYQRQLFSYLLWPFSWIYRAVIAMRRGLYGCGMLKTMHFPVPVIVVGNITVGGTGKTPLVISLADKLKQSGWRPGIVSRGYGGSATRLPQRVRPDSDPQLVGDESVLIVRKTGCPMVVCRDRTAAVATLLNHYDCNIILSDDGLQHLALGRDIEIAVVDGERRLGNGFCLPAGPLRESASRLKSVDFIVNNGFDHPGEWRMDLRPEKIYQLLDPSRRLSAAELNGLAIHAVAGIGHPQRFFKVLEKAGFNVLPHAFPDHYLFHKSDFDFNDRAPIIMTEKDAIKCLPFTDERFWCLPVRAELSTNFFTQLQLKPGQLLTLTT
jgi:tetraacyldisaccharide 4'-kinase